MACAAIIQKNLSRLYPHMVIVSSDLLRNNIAMSVPSRIESWHMPLTLSLNIGNNAVKSAPMSEISFGLLV